MAKQFNIDEESIDWQIRRHRNEPRMRMKYGRISMRDITKCSDHRKPVFGPEPARVGLVANSLLDLQAYLQMSVEAASSVFEQSASYQNELAEKKAFSAVEEIVRITEDLFGRVEVTSDFDPEFPADRHVVLIVGSDLGVKEISELEKIWIEKVGKIAKNWETFRLSIRPSA